MLNQQLKIMENLNFINILLAILGMVIHVCFKVIHTTSKSKQPFSLIQYLGNKMNYVRAVLTIASVVALMITAHDVAKYVGLLLPDGQVPSRLIFLVIGYFNHSIIRNALKMFKRRIDTAK